MNIKRTVIVAGGVVALVSAAAATAAAGPATTTAFPALSNDQPVAALTASALTSNASAPHRSYPGRTTAETNAPAPASIVSSSLNTPSASTAMQASSPSRAHGQGSAFGQLISSLAHVIPGGPDHGKLIGFFARSLNPGHTNPKHKAQ